MRVFSRWLPILALFDVISIALLLCISGIIPVSYAVSPARMDIQREAQALGCVEDYYRNQLSGDQLVIYDNMEHAYRTLSPVIDVPDGTNADDIRLVMAYVLADNPDIFWVDTDYIYQSELWGIASINVRYLYDDPAVIAEMAQRYDAQADEIIAGIRTEMDPTMDPKTDPSGYANCMARNIYIWIIRNVEYQASDGRDQTISTVFDDHVTVCAGYARAMKYLCDKAGVPCLYVSGGAYDELEESSAGSHAWNVIEIDGETYYVDATWGDEGDYADWRWFGTSPKTFYRSHTARFGDAFDRPYWPDGNRLELEDESQADPKIEKMMKDVEAQENVLGYLMGIEAGENALKDVFVEQGEETGE